MSNPPKTPIGRFAPTPSGKMHIGNIFAALIAFLSAKSKGGKFLVRIEDLDVARCPRSSADEILSDLDKLGLKPDGEVLYQSERSHVYERYEKILKDKNLVYPCFCSRAELHAAQAPHLSDGSYIYSGKCAELSPEQVEQKLQLRPACERVRVPDLEISFTDEKAGKYTQNLKRDCGDFIIRRSDGVFAYQLAVVVDDALSGVTEVVRGVDLLSSTPRQIWLCGTLGFAPPSYVHIPLLVAKDGRRLSKRDGDTLSAYLEKYSPEEIIGLIAYCSGIISKLRPITPEELVPLYRPDKLKKTIKIDV